MTGTELGRIAPGVFTAQDVDAMKRRLDKTCEELGLFPEDEAARTKLGQNIIRSALRGDIDLAESSLAEAEQVERLRFEGEEVVVVPMSRARL